MGGKESSFPPFLGGAGSRRIIYTTAYSSAAIPEPGRPADIPFDASSSASMPPHVLRIEILLIERQPVFLLLCGSPRICVVCVILGPPLWLGHKIWLQDRPILP